MHPLVIKPLSKLFSLPPDAQISLSHNRIWEAGQFMMGPEVKRFDQELAKYLDVKQAITVNSGTDFLGIGWQSLGIREEEEVISTLLFFFATGETMS